ncbi:MAG: hypothetical protein GY921_09185 [Phycisphaeraceae bacterium]|nr:hypothetical protein [Phycisphaeraceae bacterium]MCP4797108.1 hypothetical protein [Phycisphaeraceae bacterium]MCP4939344.1 hypothetical protein [Phycisphaeraceae bacterium]HAC08793.1 hypothetical protein [Phycisphaerales bacterium]
MTHASEDDAMADSRDRIEIDGLHQTGAAPRKATPASGSRFIMVWFKCCHRYGRLTRNAAETRYEGRCPRCGGRVSAGIGTEGTNRRMFEAR